MARSALGLTCALLLALALGGASAAAVPANTSVPPFVAGSWVGKARLGTEPKAHITGAISEDGSLVFHATPAPVASEPEPLATSIVGDVLSWEPQPPNAIECEEGDEEVPCLQVKDTAYLATAQLIFKSVNMPKDQMYLCVGGYATKTMWKFWGLPVHDVADCAAAWPTLKKDSQISGKFHRAPRRMGGTVPRDDASVAVANEA